MISTNSEFKTKPNPRHPDRNEDAYLEAEEDKNFAVFDGMGGLAEGEAAAIIAKEQLKSFGENIDKSSPQNTREDLKEIIKETQNQLEKEAKTRGRKSGMGTTASILTFIPDKNKGVFIHCGDSRIYRYRDEELTQLTQNHDIIWQAKKEGEIDTERAEEIRKKLNRAEEESELDQETKAYFEGRNILSSSLGSKKDPQVQTETIKLKAGDVFLLCTDGIYDNLTRSEIKSSLSSEDPKPGKLIEKAKKRFQSGAFRAKPDDLTAGIIKVSSS